MDPRCRFVPPEVERLPLPGNEWIEVKRELNAGEQRHADAGRYKELRAGERPTLDYERLGTTRILAYVTGWSLVGFDGQPVQFEAGAVSLLDMDTFQDIERAIEAHEARISDRREARKNARDGATTSPAISPSPFAVAGASSGSAI